MGRRCRCRPSPYLNNIVEQDHRFVKKRITASQGFRSVEGALSTIAGYEAMNIIRKGQIRWSPKGEALGQKRFIERLFESTSDILRQLPRYLPHYVVSGRCDTA